jgi:sugar O-acyltransferase (sialic acid O-acetyltransferase NeuD family)
MTPVAIYGAGGLGAEVLDILQQAGRSQPVAFLDSNPRLHGRDVGGLPIVGGAPHIDQLRARGVRHILVAIGDNLTRASLAETLRSHGFELASAIHPLASIALSAVIGEHVIIGPRANICVHARVAQHVIVHAGAILEHDNSVALGAFIGPAVRCAGGVSVGEFARLEIGSSVIPGRRVGPGALVRAGAVVIRDVPAHATVAGVPAVADTPGRGAFVAHLG